MMHSLLLGDSAGISTASSFPQQVAADYGGLRLRNTNVLREDEETRSEDLALSKLPSAPTVRRRTPSKRRARKGRLATATEKPTPGGSRKRKRAAEEPEDEDLAERGCALSLNRIRDSSFAKATGAFSGRRPPIARAPHQAEVAEAAHARTPVAGCVVLTIL